MKKCPFCAEEIQDEAILCRFCKHDLKAAISSVSKEPTKCVTGRCAGGDKGEWQGAQIDPRTSSAKIIATGIIVALCALLIWIYWDNTRTSETKQQTSTSSVIAPSVQKATVYEIPKGASSLISSVAGERDEKGDIVISANTNLPKETKISASVLPFGSKAVPNNILVSTDATVTVDGKLRAKFDNSSRYVATKYTVMFEAHFKSGEQPQEVLASVGEDGKRLPSHWIVPYDKEFPNNGGRLEQSFNVNFPDVSSDIKTAQAAKEAETKAIQTVKKAKLYVEGHGQYSMSADTVENSIADFVKGGAMTINNWSATELKNNTWVVTLAYTALNNPPQAKEAKWEFNKNAGKVKYLDPNAKMLSWTPSY